MLYQSPSEMLMTQEDYQYGQMQTTEMRAINDDGFEDSEMIGSSLVKGQVAVPD